MAEFDELDTETAEETSATEPEGSEIDTSELGVYQAFDYSPEPFAELSEDAKAALLELDSITDKVDVAARRWEVEQAWEQLHFDRGYQHLFKNKQGGWTLPGQSMGNGKTAPGYNSTRCTNYYTAAGDIVCSALTIEVPNVTFRPVDPTYGPDVTAAESANKFVDVWKTNNDLQELMKECARILWNEDRLMLYTRYVLNGQKFGFEDAEEVPLVPEDLETPPSTEPTGQIGDEEFEALNASPEDGSEEVKPAEKKKRKPRGREVTSAFGKLDHKVPITADTVDKMDFCKLYEDLDVSTAKASFPWIAEQINPGSDGTSEVELDRIARENVRQAVLGAYVTGDSMKRHVVIKHSWFRPSKFYDVTITEEIRAELLKAFPDGCLLVKAGSEYGFSRNERMDDHVTIVHAKAGKGQNRMSLGAPMIDAQKYINDWTDLQDSFFRRTVPKKWYNQQAFDIAAMKNNTNTPGASGPFEPQAGLTTTDQYIMVEPTPQPQAALGDFIKWFADFVTQTLTGAMPTMFGGATSTDTVGGIKEQKNQALQRMATPWNSLQSAVTQAAKQAAVCAASCREGDIKQYVPGKGKVIISSESLRGNVECYTEGSSSLPETWVQQQERIMTLLDGANGDPALKAKLMAPANLPAIFDAIKIKGITVPGTVEVQKQRNEFELLLRRGPQPNPAVVKLTAALKQAQDGIQAGHDGQGNPVPPQAAQMVQQLEQHIQGLPPMVSTVEVAQDDSEDHAIEATTCFDWLNSPEGQKFKNGIPAEKAAFLNVSLHRKEHLAVLKMLAVQNAPKDGKLPNESISMNIKDMPVSVQIQALAQIGLTATPADFQQQKSDELNKKVAEKSVPEVIRTAHQPNEPAPTYATQ